MKKCTVCGEMFEENTTYCPCGKCDACHGKLFKGAFGTSGPTAEFTYQLMMSAPSMAVATYSGVPLSEFMAFLIGLITDYEEETGKDGKEIIDVMMAEIKRNALVTLEYAYTLKDVITKADKEGSDVEALAREFIDSIEWDK